MSEAAIIWAEALGEERGERGLDVLDLAILAKLASVADDDDCAWMRVDDLAGRVGSSPRNVQYRLRKLAGQAWVSGKPVIAPLIRDTGRRYAWGHREVPIYELDVDHGLVMGVLEMRRARREGRAQVAAQMPGKTGATVCTRTPAEGVEVCTPTGATACTPMSPLETISEANASSGGARGAERGSDVVAGGETEAFRTAFGAWVEGVGSARGAASTLWGPAIEVWRVQARLAGGEAVLLGCVRAYLADPALRKRSFQLPALQHWLRDGGWRSYLGELAQASAIGAAPRGAGWIGPVEVADWLRKGGMGEGDLGAFLAPAGWDAERGAVIARTGFAARKLAAALAGSPWTVERAEAAA